VSREFNNFFIDPFQEHVKQPDDTFALMLVDTLIRLDYNTGEWKTFRTCRKLESTANQAQIQQQSNESNLSTSTNASVVI
jgi:hypothetical protein